MSRSDSGGTGVFLSTMCGVSTWLFKDKHDDELVEKKDDEEKDKGVRGVDAEDDVESNLCLWLVACCSIVVCW